MQRSGQAADREDITGQAADREDITRQAGSRRQAANGQSCIGSPGKHRETEYRGNAQKCQPGQEQDFATCVGKCAAYMWVSE